MGLGRKNLLYSMALAVVLLLFLVGYFICMLPSLRDMLLLQWYKAYGSSQPMYDVT